jgi:membrane-bound serine protease (ClpP class)
MNFVEQLLLDPNVAYVLLVVGFLLAVMAVLTPGSGLLEIGALFALLLAGWEVYNLPINLWALGVILLAAILFAFSFGKTRPLLFLGLSILALLIGSVFLFRVESGFQPAVNPILALVVSALSAGFIWFAARKTLEARRIRPTHDLDALIGAVGEAKSDIHDEGSVQVAGELWSARSEQPISVGSQVRVIGREGFTLLVESTDQHHPKTA